MAPTPSLRPALAASPDDAVREWNRHALEALVNRRDAALPGAGQPPPVAVQHIAMVQGAVYDAVNSIDRGHEPYLTGLPPASSTASLPAAVATAAHDVLVGTVMRGHPLPPSVVERLHGLEAESIAAATAQDGEEAVEEGVAAGEAAADAMLDARATDGRYGSFVFDVGHGIGEWRPTSGVNDPNAWVAKVEPFTLESPSQFRTKGPRAVSSGAYAHEYREVKDLGGDGVTTPTRRNEQQTAIASFYTGHPVDVFNRTFQDLARARQLTIVEQARLFALLNLSGADALIGCWDDKAHWGFWRPVTAIRAGADDGNPDTLGDATWTPLLGTPPYPDHPSGFSCIASALMHAGEAFFGAGRQPFSVTTAVGSPPTSVTRHYHRFRDVVADVVDARVWLGLHFRSADTQGAGLGRDVARWVVGHHFRPVER